MLLSKYTHFIIADILVAFVLFSECNTIYSYSDMVNRHLFLIVCTVFLVGAIVTRLVGKTISLDIRKLIAFMVLYFFVGGFHLFVVEKDQLFNFCYRFFVNFPLLIVYFALAGSDDKSKYSVLYRFSDIVFSFAIISLIFWYFGEIRGVFKYTSTIMVDWDSTQSTASWYGVHAGMQGLRNCGVFTEAPMYNIVICTAILVECYLREKLNMFRLIVLILTNLSTLSTTGQLILLLVCFHRFVVFKWGTMKPFVKIILIFLFVYIVMTVSYVMYSILMVKMLGSSYSVRMMYIQKSFDIWLSSPLFGIGFGENSKGSSNSLFTILADGGILFVSLYVYTMFILPLYKRLKMSWNYYYVSLFYFLMFIITIVPYNFLTFGIMALPLSNIIQKRLA